MKLGTRLTIGTVVVLALALCGCCGLVLLSNYSVLMAEIRTSTLQESVQLQRNLSISLEGLEDMGRSDHTKRALLGYYFAQLDQMASDGSDYVLQSEAGDIYNNSGIDAARVLERSTASSNPYDRYGYRESVVCSEGNHYCVSGVDITFFDENFRISVVRNITETMTVIYRMILRCVLIGAAVTVLGAILIARFLKRSLYPVEVLKQQAQAIAGGDYGCRIHLECTDELGDLAASYNQMAQAIQVHVENVEKVCQEQNMLLHAMAHEMRTPVTAISGYAYALSHGRVNGGQQKEALDFIDSESQRLVRLSTKLTQLVQVKDQVLERKKFSVADWQQCLAKILADVQLDFKSGGFISGDSDLLTILVTNLCENAKKAGASLVRVSFHEGILSVTDNGCGIPKEQMDKIMQPFYQGDASRNQEGFGLGLALCERIAKMHGTELTVESQEGKGSRFSLNLYNNFTQP